MWASRGFHNTHRGECRREVFATVPQGRRQTLKCGQDLRGHIGAGICKSTNLGQHSGWGWGETRSKQKRGGWRQPCWATGKQKGVEARCGLGLPVPSLHHLSGVPADTKQNQARSKSPPYGNPHCRPFPVPPTPFLGPFPSPFLSILHRSQLLRGLSQRGHWPSMTTV